MSGVSMANSPLGIWKESFQVLRQNWRIMLILVLTETCLKVPLSMMTGVDVDWVKTVIFGTLQILVLFSMTTGVDLDWVTMIIFGTLQILVLYAGCCWALYGAIRFDLPILLKFVVRAFILQLLIILPAQLYFLADIGSLALLPSHVAILSQGDAEVEKSIYWIKALTDGALRCVVILLFATWLPAALTSDSGGIVQALRRGWRTIWYVASRSMIGPVPVWILYSVLAMLSIETLIYLLGALGGVGEGLLVLIAFVGALVGSVVGIWTLLLVSVIISRAYLKAEKQHCASS